MKKKHQDHSRLDRREFVVGTAAVVAGAALVGCSDDDDLPAKKDSGADAPAGKEAGPGAEAGTGDGPGPVTWNVVEVHDPKSMNGKTPDATRVEAMLASGLTTLAGAKDLKAAWKTLLPGFTASKRIGIKVNCLSSYLYNSTELLAALVKTLVKDLGADAKKIVVWDRRGDELIRSKITEAKVGCPVLGTVKSTSDTSGPGYEAAALKANGKATHLSKILTQQTDLTINIPVLKTHNISAVTGALKNIYGFIDNPGDFHTDLNDYLPALYALQPIPKHCVLNITEGLLAVTKGDTSDPPDTIAARLLFSRDPVALDAHAVALINQLRGTLKPVPTAKLTWLANAEKAKLGTTKVNLKQIKIT